VAPLKSILVCVPDSVDFSDPDPDQTQARGIQLVTNWDDSVIGVVGWSDGGWDALALAAEHQDLPRLAIVSTPFPDDIDGLIDRVDLSLITSKALLIFGSQDPLTGHRHGVSWQKRLSNARLEMVPGGGHDLLEPKWGRVLSHLAPRTRQ